MRSKMRLAMLTLRIMMRSDLDIDCRDSIMDVMQNESVFSAEIRSCRSDSADNLQRETQSLVRLEVTCSNYKLVLVN